MRTSHACLFTTFLSVTLAQVGIGFPFNSQIPTVARIGQPYDFVFAANTFTPTNLDLTYALERSPPWLNIDSSARRLYGTPPADGDGLVNFTLVASGPGGTRALDCSIAVSNRPAPNVATALTQQLQPQGALSGPDTLDLRTGNVLNVSFTNDTFSSDNSISAYYARLSNHTPLPAWLAFDPDTLTFSGTAPVLDVSPQLYSINLIASDVAGYAGATASFNIMVASNQFAFEPQSDTLTVSPGGAISIDNLASQLKLNDASVPIGDVSHVNSSLPSWLQLDASTLTLEGTVPNDLSRDTANITVYSRQGESAVKSFVILPGKCTSSAASPTVPIILVPGPTRSSTATTTTAASASAAQTSGRKGISGGAIAGAVIGSIVILLIIVAALLFCIRRRKRTATAAEMYTADPRTDSMMALDDEKTHHVTGAPQIMTSLPDHNDPERRMTVSSIGAGSVMLRGDANVPYFQDADKHALDAEQLAYTEARPVNPRQSTLVSWRRLLNSRKQPRPVSDFAGTDTSSLKQPVPGHLSYAIASSNNTEGYPMSPPFDTQPHSHLGRNSQWALPDVPEASSSPLTLPDPAEVPQPPGANRRSVRLVPNTSLQSLDSRPFVERRQSWIRQRASSGAKSVLFTTESRVSQRRRISDRPIMARMHSASSSVAIRRVMSRSTRPASDRTSLYATTNSEITLSPDKNAIDSLRNELALPRHERNWVLPGEASPTASPSTIYTPHLNSSQSALRPAALRIRRRDTADMDGGAHPSKSERVTDLNVVTLTGVAAGGVLGRHPTKADKNGPSSPGLWSQRLDRKRPGSRIERLSRLGPWGGRLTPRNSVSRIAPRRQSQTSRKASKQALESWNEQENLPAELSADELRTGLGIEVGGAEVRSSPVFL